MRQEMPIGVAAWGGGQVEAIGIDEFARMLDLAPQCARHSGAERG
jgi:hypothetical protein